MVRVAKHVNEILKIICELWTNQFDVMPFGMMTVRSTFQRSIDPLFRDVIVVIEYLDDLFVFSASFDLGQMTIVETSVFVHFP